MSCRSIGKLVATGGAIIFLCLASLSDARAPDVREEPIAILLAAGDIAKCNPQSGEDEATAAVLREAVADARTRNIPVRVLALGDLAYDSGTVADFACFAQSWGAFRDIMLPVPGNHDYQNQPGTDAAPYFQYFNLSPASAASPLLEANGNKAGYYSLNFPDPALGPWRLVALNPYTLTAGGNGRQWAWLDQDLRNSPARCVLAFSHSFVLSSGHHGHNDGASPAPVIGRLILPAFRILHAQGATLLLSAHDHHFEQFAPHDASGRAVEGGVRSFVVGTGGGRLYSSSLSRWASSEAYDDRSYGVLRLDLFPDHVEWRFLPIAGGTAPTLPVTRQTCNIRP